MGALRQKMIEEIRLRNFSPRTEHSYVSAMVGLAKYYRQSPDQLSQEQIRAYLLHLKERGLSPSSRNVAISGTLADPYDRLIVAQARVAGLPLISGDGKIQESGLVRTVWD